MKTFKLPKNNIAARLEAKRLLPIEKAWHVLRLFNFIFEQKLKDGGIHSPGIYLQKHRIEIAGHHTYADIFFKDVK
jgi:hypothetical protein